MQLHAQDSRMAQVPACMGSRLAMLSLFLCLLTYKMKIMIGSLGREREWRGPNSWFY